MGSRGAIASGTHFVAIGASVRDISFLRQIALIGRQAESSGRCRGGVTPIDQMIESGG